MNHQTLASRAARAGLMGAAAVALIGLAACGQPAFDNSFNASFDKSTHDSCVKSATGGGVPAATAETYCSCFVSQLDKLTVQQKLALKGDSPALVAAENACKSTVTGGADNSAAPATDADNSASSGMGGATQPASAPSANGAE